MPHDGSAGDPLMPISPTDKVLIWSFEHNAWWAPNERGYTQQRKRAGTYDRGRAEEICAQANIARPADSPHEEIRELTVVCRFCGRPRAGHDYRHVFEPSRLPGRTP